MTTTYNYTNINTYAIDLIFIIRQPPGSEDFHNFYLNCFFSFFLVILNNIFIIKPQFTGWTLELIRARPHVHKRNHQERSVTHPSNFGHMLGTAWKRDIWRHETRVLSLHSKYWTWFKSWFVGNASKCYNWSKTCTSVGKKLVCNKNVRLHVFINIVVQFEGSLSI